MIKRVNSAGKGYEFETLRHKLLFGLQASSIPTETVYISRRYPEAKPMLKYQISPDVLDINFYPKIVRRELYYHEKVFSIFELREALDFGMIYIGKDDLE